MFDLYTSCFVMTVSIKLYLDVLSVPCLPLQARWESKVMLIMYLTLWIVMPAYSVFLIVEVGVLTFGGNYLKINLSENSFM